jgi:hypothetical protein
MMGPSPMLLTKLKRSSRNDLAYMAPLESGARPRNLMMNMRSVVAQQVEM